MSDREAIAAKGATMTAAETEKFAVYHETAKGLRRHPRVKDLDVAEKFAAKCAARGDTHVVIKFAIGDGDFQDLATIVDNRPDHER
jgi:hypothetical protein